MSRVVAEAIGLHFPTERQADLERGLVAATRELGFDDTRWILAQPGPAALSVLASHLTVGETYFFRDDPTIEVLRAQVLPELIFARRGGRRALRIWSAGCCTGEEPYSIAMLLHQLLPDIEDWKVSIVGTDVNPRFLEKARAGVYGRWSFRNTPARLRQRFFRAADEAAGPWGISPDVAGLVTFSRMNLVQDPPPLGVGPGAGDPFDLIVCRNVLMYFAPTQIEMALARFRDALHLDGWLAVGPGEVPSSLDSVFEPVSCPGSIFYRRRRRTAAHPPGDAPAPTAAPPAPSCAWSPAPAGPGAPAMPADRGLPAQDEAAANLPAQARSLADQGRLPEALACCERWLAADKLNASAHYLHATILAERGDLSEAAASLQRATYLQPDFVLAHFALATLARRQGRHAAARRHVVNARELLARQPADEPLPESGGLYPRDLERSLHLGAGR